MRVDSSHEVGMGHLIRCLSLSEVLRQMADCDIRFAMRWDPHAEKYLSRTQFGRGVEFVDDEKEISSFHEIMRRVLPRAVVFDIPLADRVGEYFAQVPRGILKVSLHEHNYSILSGDIVIAPTVRPLAVAPGGSAGLTHFSGGEYAILSLDIEKMRDRVKPPGEDVRNGFISLGGADPGYLTLEILAAVMGLSRGQTTWNIVLGPSSGYDAARLQIEYPDFTRFHEGLGLGRGQYLDILGRSDLAITNAGTTLYEALALGRPTVAVPQNEFETEVAGVLSAAGACLTFQGACSRRVELAKIMADRERRTQMAANGKATLDGRGAQRVAEKILFNLG
jgi:spore coat polysaccharide biosynthesis predicted glycosyltransferase SpsG